MKRFFIIILMLLMSNTVYSADVAITGLTNDPSPSTDDLLVTVDSPGGTPVTKKATIGSMLVDGNIPNNITIDYATSSGSSATSTFATSVTSDGTWTAHNSYPTACSAGEYVNAIGDTLTCTDATTEINTALSGYMQDTDIDTFSELNTWITDATLIKSGGTLTSGYICRYDGTGVDCDRVEDASGACGANAVCMGGHTHAITSEVSGLGTNMATFLATPSSANLRGTVTDESGTGALIFAGGNIGAATATTPAENDNDTSVATTAYVQTEIAGLGSGTGTIDGSGDTNAVAYWSASTTITYDADFAYDTSTKTMSANTVNVDFIESTGGVTTINNTLYVDSSGPGGFTFTTVDADPCATLGEGGLFYNGANFCYCDGTNDVLIWDNTTACF